VRGSFVPRAADRVAEGAPGALSGVPRTRCANTGVPDNNAARPQGRPVPGKPSTRGSPTPCAQYQGGPVTGEPNTRRARYCVRRSSPSRSPAPNSTSLRHRADCVPEPHRDQPRLPHQGLGEAVTDGPWADLVVRRLKRARLRDCVPRAAGRVGEAGPDALGGPLRTERVQFGSSAVAQRPRPPELKPVAGPWKDWAWPQRAERRTQACSNPFWNLAHESDAALVCRTWMQPAAHYVVEVLEHGGGGLQPRTAAGRNLNTRGGALRAKLSGLLV
jgi:hypothetical protein